MWLAMLVPFLLVVVVSGCCRRSDESPPPQITSSVVKYEPEKEEEREEGENASEKEKRVEQLAKAIISKVEDSSPIIELRDNNSMAETSGPKEGGRIRKKKKSLTKKGENSKRVTFIENTTISKSKLSLEDFSQKRNLDTKRRMI